MRDEGLPRAQAEEGHRARGASRCRDPDDLPKDNVQETVCDEAVVFKPHKAEGHVKDAAPQRRDGIWSDFNSRNHESIVSGEGEIVPI